MTDKIPHRLVSYNLAEALQQMIDLSKLGYTLNTKNKFYPEHYLGRTVIHMDEPEAVQAPVQTTVVTKLVAALTLDTTEAKKKLNELIEQIKASGIAFSADEFEEIIASVTDAFEVAFISNENTKPEQEAPDGFEDPVEIGVDTAKQEDKTGVAVVKTEEIKVEEQPQYRAGPGRGHKKQR